MINVLTVILQLFLMDYMQILQKYFVTLVHSTALF
jgi:hypothetical protein